MDFSQLFAAAIEKALNHYLSLDSEGMARFDALQGRSIAIEIKGLQQTLSLFPSADGMLVLTDFDSEADATISGSPMALARLGLQDDAKDLIQSGAISIRGDSRLANQFNRLLAQLDIDYEEILAQTTGDIAAHKIANLVRATGQWLSRSAHSLSQDGAEYLQEEIRLSPSNAELRAFIREVDELREATDRLQASLQIIKNRKQ